MDLIVLFRRESYTFVWLCCYRSFRDSLFFFKEQAAEEAVVFGEIYSLLDGRGLCNRF